MNHMKFPLYLNWKPAVFIAAFFLTECALWACSTCSSEYSQEKINAYLSITALLIALPILFVSSVGFYFYRKIKARNNAE